MKRILLLACLAIMCWSCAKDDFTKPVGVNLQMEIQNQEVGINQRTKLNSIHIERGRYLLSEVEFRGYRENGEDYFFEKEFEPGLEASMVTGSPATALNFDMPQGLYKRISISLKVVKNTDSGEDDEQEEEDDAEGEDDRDDKAFDENASLILYGTYTNARDQQIPLIFVYNYDDSFEFTARADNAQEAIMVGNGEQANASLSFNPSYWLQLINSRMLESARLTSVDGVSTIILSDKQNEHIFDLLASRIKDASALSFN